MRRSAAVAIVSGLVAATAATPQQTTYSPINITGQLTLVRTVNLSQVAAAFPLQATKASTGQASGPETSRLRSQFPAPPSVRGAAGFQVAGFAAPLAQSLVISPPGGAFGFDGLTHSEQRLAYQGNQFSVEPPNPSIAVANGKVLEGVNSAVRVYTTAGVPLIAPTAVNQLFGVGPAIDRSQNPAVYGVYGTDMRVFFDADISRWFVLQRAQDEDTAGNPLNSSHIYLAVSQTNDPAGNYNIYIMDSSDRENLAGCPCIPDYPQLGADRYGFYISANEYDTFGSGPFGATILAISKAALGAGVPSPTMVRFIVPYFTGYEFTIQPATTPPGASPLITNGGVEFFVSSYPVGLDSFLALWAMSNTASLQSESPSLVLTQTTVPVLLHAPPPGVATQKSGPLSLGTSLEFLDAGFFSDARVLSTVYSGGRLFVSLASLVNDEGGHNLAGGAYFVFSPTLRNGVLSATAPLRQGYIVAPNNHLLRPAISVNAQGKGAIAFTLTGPDYFPSAAFAAVSTTSSPAAIQIAALGSAPEDGFSGYPDYGGFGVARWGDYATAVTSTDGSIWLVSEYIPNAPRTPLANWGTFVSQYLP